LGEVTVLNAFSDFVSLSQTYAKELQIDPLSDRPISSDFRTSALEKIRNELETIDGGWPVQFVFDLRKSIEIACHLEELSVEYWHILGFVVEALRGVDTCRSFSEKDAWRRALDCASEAINESSFRESISAHSREAHVAQAIRHLRSKGYRIRITERGAQIPPSEYRRICQEIGKNIQRAGGWGSANKLLDIMRSLGRIQDGSLIHARTPRVFGGTMSEPGTPWHYIYSICLKNLPELGRGSEGTRNKNLQQMEDLARSLAAVINVEPHNPFENMTIAGSSLMRVLRDTLLYDEMFAFPQWQPMVATSLVADWIEMLRSSGCAFPIVSAEKWSDFACQLLSVSKEGRLVPVSPGQLVCGSLSYDDAANLIKACKPDSGSVNADYNKPDDTTARDSSYYPLLSGPNRSVYAQPAGPVARAVCERLFTLMREQSDPHLGRKMGSALECLTAKILRDAGLTVSVFNGHYPNPDGGTDLEVDIVVETKDRIFLFECKKKPLTNRARRGDSLASLEDLDQSFLKFTEQLARHEAVLRSQGFLKFRNGQEIELNDRKIEKFGISLFDHSSLQHRDMTWSLLELLIGKNLVVDDPKMESVCKSINRKLSNINRSIISIIDYQSGKRENLLHDFLMSTWWLSIDQLSYAIFKRGDLWEGIKYIRHLTKRSGDTIYDIHAFQDLSENVEAMYNVSEKMNSRSFV